MRLSASKPGIDRSSRVAGLRRGSSWRHWQRGIGLTLMAVQAAQAAQGSDPDWAELQAEARRTGHATVLVHLLEASLQQIAEQPQAVNEASQARLAALSAELGNGVLPHGRWANGMGQAQLHLSLPGLDRLRQSQGAILFTRGIPWQERSGMDGLDGGLQQIEQSIDRDGFADIEVTPNIDGLQFDIPADGNNRLSAEPSAVSAALERLRPVLQAAGGVIDETSIIQIALVRRDGLLALAYSDTVRHLRPKGHVDSRPREVDPALVEAANAGADVQFILTLRSSISGGRLSEASRRGVATSHHAALQALLAQAAPNTIVQDYSPLGAAQVRMGSTAFKNLLAGNDRRCMTATPLREVGRPQLATSAGSMNMNAAWSLATLARGKTSLFLIQACRPVTPSSADG